MSSPCSPRDSQESSPPLQFESTNSSALSLLYGPTLVNVLASLSLSVDIMTCIEHNYYFLHFLPFFLQELLVFFISKTEKKCALFTLIHTKVCVTAVLFYNYTAAS